MLSRQREIEELDSALSQAAQRRAERPAAGGTGRAERRYRRRIAPRSTICASRIDEEQQRHHALQMEALRLPSRRNERIASAHEQIARRVGRDRRADRSSRALRNGSRQNCGSVTWRKSRMARRGAARRSRPSFIGAPKPCCSSSAIALQAARDEAQRTAFHQQSCQDKINEIDSISSSFVSK